VLNDVYLSVPLRMKHEGEFMYNWIDRTFQFLWGWNNVKDVSLTTTSNHFQFLWGWNSYTVSLFLSLTLSIFQFLWGWNCHSGQGSLLNQSYFQFLWGWNLPRHVIPDWGLSVLSVPLRIKHEKSGEAP